MRLKQVLLPVIATFLVLAAPGLALTPDAPAAERDPFPKAVPDCFGINTHFWDFSAGGKRGTGATWSLEKWEAWWGKTNPLEEMARSGFTLHRFMVDWESMEETKGTYDWGLQDALMKESERHGMRPVLFLAYGNPKYDKTSGPSPDNGVHAVLTDEGREGFARWAGAVAARYKGKRCIYEVWNEPNIKPFWPTPDPEAYVALVRAAAAAVRKADPKALIAGGALSPKDLGEEFDLPFLTRCLELGMLEHVDIVSWHPYNLDSPEVVRGQIEELKGLIRKHAPKGKAVEPLCTEVGYSPPPESADVLKGHGHYVPRMLLSNLSLGVPTVWYEAMPNYTGYSLTERPRSGTDGHYLFPTTIAWGQKPGAMATRVLTDALRGFTFTRRLAVGEAKTDYVLEFVRDGRIALAAWTTDDAGREVTVPLPAGSGTLVSWAAVQGDEAVQKRLMGDDYRGVRSKVDWNDPGVKLKLSPWPQYLLVERGGR